MEVFSFNFLLFLIYSIIGWIIEVCNFLVVDKKFVNRGFMHIVSYFEFDDYGKYHHPKKEAKTYDVKNHYSIFLTGKTFKSYTSKYLRVLNKDKPLYNKGNFTDLDLSESQIKYIYRDKI